MSVQALGYVGVRARNLEDWANYGQNLLGLQRIDKTRSSMAFRMDDRKQRLLVDADGGQGIGFFGWEMADAAAMDAIGARLAGVPKEVLERAKQILGNLEESELTPEGNVRPPRKQQDREKLKNLAPSPQGDLFG